MEPYVTARPVAFALSAFIVAFATEREISCIQRPLCSINEMTMNFTDISDIFIDLKSHVLSF